MAFVAACAQEVPPFFTDPLAGLSFEDQARAAEKEFLDVAKANAAKSCVRPVLRGAPLPGRAAEDIIAVVEKAGKKDSCYSSLRTARDFDVFDFCYDHTGSSEDGFPGRRLCAVRAPKSIDAEHRANGQSDINRRSDVDAVRQDCAPAVAGIGRAVAHEDACSPYLPGVRHVERHSDKFRYLASWVAAEALERAGAGEPRQAAESLLDLIRFDQDLHRGGIGSSHLDYDESARVPAASWGAVSALERILNRKEPLGAPLLAQIDRELAALIASELRPYELLAGEAPSTAMYAALPMVHGPRWSPPGVRVGQPSEPTAQRVRLGGQWLVALHGLRLFFETACRPGDSDLACFERMTALVADARGLLPRERKSIRRWLEWIVDSAAAPPDGYTSLSLIVEAGEDYADRVREHGQTRFYLGALRLLARYRALAEETGACPGIEAFDRPDLADARSDPYSGRPLKVEEIGAGRFVVSSPAKLELGPYPNDAITIRVKCPFAGETQARTDGGV